MESTVSYTFRQLSCLKKSTDTSSIGYRVGSVVLLVSSKRQKTLDLAGNRNMIPQRPNLYPRRHTNCSIHVYKTFPYLSQYTLQAGKHSPLPVATYCGVQNSCTASTQFCAVCTENIYWERSGLRAKLSTSCDLYVYSQWHCEY